VESLINNANFLVAKVTGFTGSDDRLSYGGLDEPGRYDLDSGFEWSTRTRPATRTLTGSPWTPRGTCSRMG